MSVIVRTSCWKQASAAMAGRVAEAWAANVLGAWDTHRSVASKENNRTMDQEWAARRWCRAALRMDREPTIQGP